MNLDRNFADTVYDELSFWSAHFGALLFDNLELRPNVRGLDVGCGAGFPLFELAHVHGPSSHFTGIDPWPEAMARAERKRAFYGLTNVELHTADAASMPFPDQTFDLITSNLGINNFEEPARVLAECFRVAKPGARIVVTTNITGHMASFYSLLRLTLNDYGRADLIPALDAQEADRGARASVTQLLTSAGFHTWRVIEDEFHMKFADGTAMLRHQLVHFFMEGWKRVTDDEAIWNEIERRLNAVSPLRFRIPMLLVAGVRP